MSGISILCKHCGNEFHSNWAAAQYCSDKCRVAAHRERQKSEPKPLRRCPGCYQSFVAKNAKRRYCSNACKMKSLRRYDWDGKYGAKKGEEQTSEQIPVEVTYNEREAINSAWSEALE